MKDQTRITRICKICSIEKTIDQFYLDRKGCRDNRCKPCKLIQKRSSSIRPEILAGRNQRLRSRRKEERSSGLFVAKYVILDAKGIDRKRGWKNDLDEEFVEKMISDGCSYCEEADMHISLDRIDNCLPHLKSNVVAACERCNYMRRDMPIKAWMELLPSIVSAREKGLFGNWNPCVHRRIVSSDQIPLKRRGKIQSPVVASIR